MDAYNDIQATPFAGGGFPYQPPPPISPGVALRILDRIKEIADDEGLDMGASFGSNNFPFGGPLQVTFSVKR